MHRSRLIAGNTKYNPMPDETESSSRDDASRDALASELLISSALEVECAGNAGCWPQPMSLKKLAGLQKKSRRQSPQVQPKTTGIPRAMVYSVLRALPGEPAVLQPSLV